MNQMMGQRIENNHNKSSLENWIQKTLSLSLLLFLGTGFSACKTAGDVASGRDKQYVDPTEVRTVDKAEVVPSSPSTERLQQELAVTRGELENARVNSAREQESLREKITELENKNKALTDDLLKVKQAVPAAPVPEATPSLAGKAGAAGLWELALSDLKAGHYAKAVAPLDELIKTYPKDAHVFYALLALGMSHYQNKSFDDAAVTFNRLIDKYPKKKETGYAWYGQAASFLQLKQTEDAKLLFGEIIKRYPNTLEAGASKKMLRKKSRPPVDLFAQFPDSLNGAPRP